MKEKHDRVLGRLVDLGLIDPRDKGHKLFDPFFRQWLLARRVGS